jgi:hypothetical protein
VRPRYRVHLALPLTVALMVLLLAVLGTAVARQAGLGDGAGASRRGAQVTPRDPVEAPALPCTGVTVAPADDLQRAIDTYPARTTFCLEAGVHRLVHARPKDGQRFIGRGLDTILSGARILAAADASRDGAGRWYWAGQTQQSAPHGVLIRSGFPAARPNEGDRYSEELFVTASGDPRDPPRRYQRVLGFAELGPGRWYLDEDANRIYMTDDPARLGLIETSVASTAISAPARLERANVVIQNLVVEKYASGAQQAAVGGSGATDWDFRSVTVRYNHGAGVELGPGTIIEHCKIHHMGQIGLLGGGDATTRPTVLRDTEVADNRTLSFDPDWETGGAKFTRSFGQGMIVENSWFHDNSGGGLWFDIDNYNVVIRSNRFEDNQRWGVFYEVSRQARIYLNEVLGTTNGPEGFVDKGAGILVSNSADVDIYQNLLRDNDNGIFINEDGKATRWAQDTYREGLPHIHDVDIHENDIGMRRGVTGMRVENGDPNGYWQPSNVRFADNTYRVDATAERFIGVDNNLYRFHEWDALGNDGNGRALPISTTGSLPGQATKFAVTQYGAKEGGD